MEYGRTLTSAREHSLNAKLEEWIHAFLLSDGDNKGLSDGLKLEERAFLGPVKMPSSLFSRCCGPEEEMGWHVDKDGFEKRVGRLQEAISNGADLPPLIVNFDDGQFQLNDGNHRFEAYSRLGIQEVNVIIWTTGQADYDRFVSEYAAYLS